MKKLIILALLTALVLSGCSAKNEAPAGSPTQTETLDLEPIYGDQIADGTYSITVDSSSSMFRVVNCDLTVENGKMTAVMTMSGQGYGKLYMGTGEQALEAGEEEYIPFELDSEGAKTFTVPVEALNMETDCAAWSIKKESWYDRVLVFRSEGVPDSAITEG